MCICFSGYLCCCSCLSTCFICIFAAVRMFVFKVVRARVYASSVLEPLCVWVYMLLCVRVIANIRVMHVFMHKIVYVFA